jgi:hypothetical membrane protein
MSGKERIEKIKNTHYLVSIFLFIATFFFCSYSASDLRIVEISLSHFGITEKIGYLWNASLFIIGITLLIEAYLNINKYLLDNGLLYLFVAAIIGLFITAAIDMNHTIHYYSAYTYFIGFTLGMFLFGFRLIKTDFRIGITSIIIAVISVLCPLAIVMYLHTFAIPELTHTSFVFVWVMVTRFDNRYKNFLKRIGL